MFAPVRMSIVFAVLLVFGGCQGPPSVESSRTLDVTGPITIDVESFGGDVIVTGIDEGAQATIHFQRVGLHGKDRKDEAAASLKEISTSAEVLPGEIGQTLRIRAATTHAEPHFQRVHITIEVPNIDGVRVLTQRGKVYVQNVTGTIDLETTDDDVRLMTTQPLARPVTIVNRDGDIDFRIRGDSRGEFDCEAEEGAVIHRVRLGGLRILADTDHDTLKATLNGGDNPIVLRTVNGDIRIAIIDDPEAVGLRILEP